MPSPSLSPIPSPGPTPTQPIDPHTPILIEDITTRKVAPEKPPKTSDVWKHVDDLGDSKFQCKKCKGTIRNDPKNGTSCLLRHIERCLNREVDDKKQMKFTVDVKNRSKLSEEDQEKSNYDLLRIIVCDERPFAFASSESFAEFCKTLNPLYKVPVYNTLVKRLDSLYENLQKTLSILISNLSYFSITMDGWKSLTMDSYLTLEVHYWDKDASCKRCRTWNVFVVEDIHCTAEVIQRVLTEHFHKLEWNSTLQSRIITSVSDGGSNITKAMSLMNIRNIHCCPHTINVICQKGLLQCNEIFTKAKKFVTWINESSVAWFTLKKHQVTENQMKDLSNYVYCVVQEVSTRWNSFYYLVDRLLLLEDCITKTTTELNVPDRLTISDFKVLKELQFLFAPFEEATRLLSSDSQSTVQYILPTMISLKKKTETLIINNTEVNEVRKVLLYELDIELKCYLGNNQLLIATVCDPRLKTLTFVEQHVRERAYTLVRDTLAVMQNSNGSRVDRQEKSTVSMEGNDSLISDFFIHTDLESESDELALYLVDSVRKLGDATQYWVENNQKYPRLFEIALAHLSIPSSSTSSERNNSQMGRVVTKTRNRLDPNTVVRMNLMKGNMDIW